MGEGEKWRMGEEEMANGRRGNGEWEKGRNGEWEKGKWVKGRRGNG